MGSRRIAQALVFLALLAAPAAAEWVAGYDGDDTRGLGYITRYERIHLAPGRQLVLSGTASYLFYDVQDAGGTTRVTSPGLGAAAVYRWIYPRIEFGLGPGYEARWTRRRTPSAESTREVEHGVLALGDLHYRPDDLTRLSLAGSYSDANQWAWGYGNVVRELSPGLRAGPEASIQGNDDVRVRSWGGLVEFPYGDRTALQLHGGQARIRYRSGVEESRPYFSVSLVRRF